MDYFKRAWEIVKQDYVSWLIVFIVYNMVVSATCGLGAALMPNVFRTIRKSIADGTKPEIGDVFNFDEIADDLIATILRGVADTIGLMLCFVGVFATSVLFFWVPLVASENRYAAVDQLKASFAHAKTAPGTIFVFMLTLAGVNILGMLCCYVGLFVTAPVSLVAIALFYEDHREDILAAADAAGVPTK